MGGNVFFQFCTYLDKQNNRIKQTKELRTNVNIYKINVNIYNFNFNKYV